MPTPETCGLQVTAGYDIQADYAVFLFFKQHTGNVTINSTKLIKLTPKEEKHLDSELHHIYGCHLISNFASELLNSMVALSIHRENQRTPIWES